ncbi:unnamed protein product [Nippostrongylus brasiliensis]|uniref:G protein-coupled receptor n=1 Tax=Nippostrongylus brasiliensis TaxID=27835 RepID=A0A0N4XJL8_NIPBR|nr:unnamed protein product [Nippostrongylus brasiliensis]
METDPRLVTETNEKIVEGVQMFNSVCATVIGLSIHSYILYRISKNFSTLNSYQHLIVVQSVISLVSVAVRFVANQRTTLYEQNVLFLPFLSIGEAVKTITLSILIFLDSLDMFLIITLNIHRVLLFMNFSTKTNVKETVRVLQDKYEISINSHVFTNFHVNQAKLGEKVLRVIRTFRLCLQHNAESIDGTIDG